MTIPILFEDDHLLVLDKPAGIVVTRSETSSDQTVEDFLVNDLKIPIDRGGIVHRLDKDTSGLLLVAKTQQSLEHLQAQFQERTVKKEYLALVHGHVSQKGQIVGAITRNPENREKFMVTDEEGKNAVTDYQPEQKLQMTDQTVEELYEDFNKIQLRKLEQLNYRQFTLVRCFPLTGRTHQIRVHLKYIGFPIVGDDKYGGRKVVRLDHRWCPRQFLHAQNLAFHHPITNELLTFSSELTEDLKLALSKLEKIEDGTRN